MRQFSYTALRKLPSWGATVVAFVTGSWSGADYPSFKAWALWKWERLDVSATGWLVAACIAIYVAALWVSRDWNKTDRDHYRRNLQAWQIHHNNEMHVLMHLKAEDELNPAVGSLVKMMNDCVGWLERNMGQSAVSKYIAVSLGSSILFWPGKSTEAMEKRSHWYITLEARRDNLEAMLASDRWDDPTPLAVRDRRRKLAVWKEWIWKKIGRKGASTAS